MKIYLTKEVSAYLQPGTAIKITVLGNISTIDAPYIARLISYYAESESINIRIISNVSSLKHLIVCIVD